MTAHTIAFWGFLLISLILLGFAAIVLGKIVVGKININDMLAEPAAPSAELGEISKASLSRFQFLIFTFVIAGLFMMLSIEAGTFVEIPGNVLALLGISGGSYIASKAMNKVPDAPDKIDRAAALRAAKAVKAAKAARAARNAP
jgi:hypothetical protein